MPLHGANRQRPTNRERVDMNKVSGIYRIELGNGYFYIGSAVDLGRRRRSHQNTLKCGTHVNKIMQRNWDKYGVFIFVVLDECGISDLLIKEQTLIDQHFDDALNVNLAPTAGSCLGKPHSLETRAKISASHKGITHSDESREKMSASHKGVPMSDDTRKAMSAAQKGIPKSMAHRKNLSKPKSAEHRANMVAAWVRRRAG